MWRIARAFRRAERGQGLIEYALILVIVSVALIGALGLFEDDVTALYGRISDAFP
jgi:Flp pilus assembly pilin Flp